MEPPAEVLARAADLLARRHVNIELRWAQRVVTFGHFQGRGDLHLADVLDHMPLLTEAIIAVLRDGHQPDAFQSGGEYFNRARTHAWTRHEQGIRPEEVIDELRVFRAEIWRELRHRLPRERSLTAEEVFVLEEHVTYALDLIIGASLQALRDLELPDLSSFPPLSAED
ncbi:MAG TPA: hypothetical protein VII06_08080 [Chloroflexota bacterium]